MKITLLLLALVVLIGCSHPPSNTTGNTICPTTGQPLPCPCPDGTPKPCNHGTGLQ